MVHLSHRIKEAGEMTASTIRDRHGNMIIRLTKGINIVMAGYAVVANIIVIKAHRQPAEVGVAIRTLVVHGNMIHGFASNDNVVMAVLAAAKYFMVVHHGNGLKPDGAVAGVATLASKDMLHRFWRGVKTTVDAVAGDTFGGGTGKLTTNVATLARHEVMAAGKFKTGRCVIEALILPQRYTAKTPRQNH